MGDAVTNNEAENARARHPAVLRAQAEMRLDLDGDMSASARATAPAVSVEVANPKHYVDKDDEFQEPIDRIRNVGFNFGSADKYLTRLGKKGGENTEARDSGSTIWYCFDLMAHLLATDDGEYAPTLVSVHEFSPEEYVSHVLSHATNYEEETDLLYAELHHKRFVLAAMHSCIRMYDDAARVGMSDSQFRTFVQFVLMTAVVVIDFAGNFNRKPLFSIYNGSKFFPLTDELRLQLEATFKALANRGVIEVASTLGWGCNVSVKVND